MDVDRTHLKTINFNLSQENPVKSEKAGKPSQWMPDVVRRYHERRDSNDRVPVAGDSPEDFMSPIVRIPCCLLIFRFRNRGHKGGHSQMTSALRRDGWLRNLHILRKTFA